MIPASDGTDRIIEVLHTNSHPNHLKIKNNYLYWTERSDTPLNRISLDGGGIEPLANKIGVSINIVIYGQYVYWVDDQRGRVILYKTTRDGTLAEKLAEGVNIYGATTDLVVDDEFVFWVNDATTTSGSVLNLVK